MSVWWNNLSSFQQVMFIIAASATIIMLIMLILMLIGIGDNDVSDVDVDVDTEPIANIGGLKVFTLRGALAFLSIGGWLSFILDDSMKSIWALLLGILAGGVASFLQALFFRSIKNIEQDGSLNYKDAIGKVGTVYIRIPAKRSGVGKVNITLQERFIEIDAVTDDEADLKTGMAIKVIGTLNESTLIVEKEK